MTQFTCKGVKQINNRISLNRISRRFSSAREFQMGNFQKYWSQNVDQDFIVLDFFHVWKIFVGEKSCGRKRCVREINVSRTGDQSMREIRLLRGRLPWKGGGLTGMQSRENQRGNQEWTIQRKPKGKSRMDNPEKTKGEIKNGQSHTC